MSHRASVTPDWRGPNAALVGKPGSRTLLDTPALVLDLDQLDSNIRSMALHSQSRGYQLRPCVKTHKSVEIARRQVEAGAVGVCSSTLAEAEAMVDGGIESVLLFAPVVSESKLQRLAALAARTQDLIVVADDSDNVSALASVARAAGQTIQVLVDVEVGGGRTGVALEDDAVSLACQIADTAGLQFAGLQAYNGRDARAADYDARRAALLGAARQLAQLVERLDAEGLHPGIVSGGGTATHDIDHEAAVLTELQVGTYVFMDLNYMERVLRRDNPHPFRLSLTVRGTVISAAKTGFVITDVGAKEVDGFRGTIDPIVYTGAPEGSRYSIVGDDLGRIDFAHSTESLPVGSPIEVVPPHCFQTIVLHSVYHCVSGDELVDIWPIDGLANL